MDDTKTGCGSGRLHWTELRPRCIIDSRERESMARVSGAASYTTSYQKSKSALSRMPRRYTILTLLLLRFLHRRIRDRDYAVSQAVHCFFHLSDLLRRLSQMTAVKVA